MDFRPKEILFGTNSDGTKFRIENWNYDAFAGVDLARGLVNLCWLIFLGFLISPYFLLITLMVYCGRFNYLNILGAIIGTYMLYDAYNGWPFTAGMHIFFNEKWMNYIIYLNVISVVLHVFLSLSYFRTTGAVMGLGLVLLLRMLRVEQPPPLSPVHLQMF